MNKPSDQLIKNVLNNVASKKEAKLVAEWFATSEGIKYLDAYLDNNNEIIDTDFSKQEVLQKINTTITSKKETPLFMKIAAVIIPLIALTTLLWFIKPTLFSDTINNLAINTQKGEIKTTTLTDGTVVYLNPETELIFPEKFNDTVRKVQLNGEAYFDVAKDKNRPFIIELQKATIKVLGTSFNVKSYQEEKNIDVLLDEGSIAFKTDDTNLNKLIAGETIKYNKQNGSVQKSKLPQKISYLKGKDNVIIFNNDNLKTVLNTLSRWYDVSFAVKNADTYQFSYTTFFKNAELQDVLSELETISKIKFKKNKEVIEVIHQK